MKIRVGLTVLTENQDVVARVIEQLARTAAGLALEGVECLVMAGPDDDGDDGL